MSENSCCICGTVKNCGEYLEKVFENISKIIELFKEYFIIIYYDDSYDNSLELLLKYKELFKMHIYHNQNPKNYRTHRLADGRNYCLKYINTYYSHYKYFIMMDFDNVCSNNINISILRKHIENDSEWDSLSFNKDIYYDLWALSIRPYIFSYIHFKNPHEVLNNMGIYVKNQLNLLKKDQLLPCYSAFNGFAIYKTNIFKDCVYDGNVRLDLIPLKYLHETLKQNKSGIVFENHSWLNSTKEDCEHRSFHFQAIKKYNARIFISPEILINN